VINTINGKSLLPRRPHSRLTKSRFYVIPTTGAWQWEYPSGPAYASQPAAQYAQQGFAPPPTAAQPAVPATTGIMGKFSNLDPKAQTALAVGGGLAAGALLEHEIDEYSGTPHLPHHGGHHHVFGSMASIIGATGAGVLGAKLFGGNGQAAQTTPPPLAPQANPAQAPPPPVYPGQPMPPGAPSSNPGLWGLGKFAVGGATGVAGALAVSEASNLLHHHQNQGGAPTATGGSGGITSFLGGLTHSGPRLIIHAAAFADKDVTDRVRALVTPEQVLTIENMQGEFGDPWPETKRKMFSVLYQYGDRPLEIWAGR
jgi:hypothetical protein